LQFEATGRLDDDVTREGVIDDQLEVDPVWEQQPLPVIGGEPYRDIDGKHRVFRSDAQSAAVEDREVQRIRPPEVLVDLLEPTRRIYLLGQAEFDWPDGERPGLREHLDWATTHSAYALTIDYLVHPKKDHSSVGRPHDVPDQYLMAPCATGKGNRIERRLAAHRRGTGQEVNTVTGGAERLTFHPILGAVIRRHAGVGFGVSRVVGRRIRSLGLRRFEALSPRTPDTWLDELPRSGHAPLDAITGSGAPAVTVRAVRLFRDTRILVTRPKYTGTIVTDSVASEAVGVASACIPGACEMIGAPPKSRQTDLTGPTVSILGARRAWKLDGLAGDDDEER
jgi:hypothetical protein